MSELIAFSDEHTARLLVGRLQQMGGGPASMFDVQEHFAPLAGAAEAAGWLAAERHGWVLIEAHPDSLWPGDRLVTLTAAGRTITPRTAHG